MNPAATFTPASPVSAPSRKVCKKCGQIKDLGGFGLRRNQPDGRSKTCRDCDRQWAIDHKAAKAKRLVERLANAASNQDGYEPDEEPEPEPVIPPLGPDDFIATKELISTWAAVQMIAASGDPAPNMFFQGPSGSGKTRAAQHLAKLAGLDFIKVDAPSMTDPEAWFGTREIVVEDGASKTIFRDSEFAQWLQKPCVLLIDEMNRVADAVRGILLPAFDDSRAVTNPLTGETIHRHPACFIIMTGNVGLSFTGTHAIDPAFLTRALVTTFDYLGAEDETRLAIARTKCSPAQASLFVRFANETRQRAKGDDEFPPISTREVLVACALVAKGLDERTAADQVIINAASVDGGAESIHFKLEGIWGGIHDPQTRYNPLVK